MKKNQTKLTNNTTNIQHIQQIFTAIISKQGFTNGLKNNRLNVET